MKRIANFLAIILEEPIVHLSLLPVFGFLWPMIMYGVLTDGGKLDLSPLQGLLVAAPYAITVGFIILLCILGFIKWVIGCWEESCDENIS